MRIITTWHNPNEFSWITIEKEDDTYFMFVNNKMGVHRELKHSKNREYIFKSLDWQKDFAIRMNEIMKGVIEKLEKENKK